MKALANFVRGEKLEKNKNLKKKKKNH